MNVLTPSAVAEAAWRRASAAAAAAAIACALAGCGGEPAQSDPGEGAATDTSTSASVAAAPDAAAPTPLVAALDWPQGADDFALSACVSIGESTIQGAGSSADWTLYFDANLLAPDDTGTLQVSRAADSTVEYDADILELAVQPDGTFRATGQDAAGAGFRLTGTCSLS